MSFDHLVLRLVVRTRTSAKDDVARELRNRIRTALHHAGLVLPPMSAVTPATEANPLADQSKQHPEAKPHPASKPATRPTDASGLSDERRPDGTPS